MGHRSYLASGVFGLADVGADLAKWKRSFVQSIPHEKQWDFFLGSCSIPFVPSPLVCLSSVEGVTSLPLLSKMLRRRSRPSPFVTGVEEAARSVAGRVLPAVTVGFGPGWKG